MLVPLESSSAVLVMISSSKSVSICNLSLARLDNSSRNCTFWRGYPNLMHSYEDSLNLGGQTLHRWNLCLMPNISYAGCPGLSWMVSAHFSLKCVLQPKIAKNSLKPPICGVQGHRCWYHWKLVSSACYDKQQVCLSATILMLDEPIVVKLRFLLVGVVEYTSLMPSFEGNLLTQRHQITSLETKNSRLSCGDARTAVAHKNDVKLFLNNDIVVFVGLYSHPTPFHSSNVPSNR